MAHHTIRPLDIFSQLYIGDYFADTLTFTADEHAAFRLLLLHTWLVNDGVAHDLPGIAGVDPEQWHDLAPAILPLLVAARSKIAAWKAGLKPYNGMRLPPEDWYVVRTITLERDGYRCHYCGSTRRLHVDHKIPLIRGGSNGFENLVTSCG